MRPGARLCVFLAALVFLPVFAAAAVPEGRPAPKAAMKLLKAGAVSDFPGWEAYKGKVVVLEFWATWCVPCIGNIPHLNALAAAFRGKPVEFISVSNERAPAVKKFLQTHPMSGSVAVGGNDAWRAFGVKHVPQTVIIGKSGAVLRYTSPELLSEATLGRLLDSGSAEGIKSVNYTRAGEPEKAADTPVLFEVRVTSASCEGGSRNGRGSDGGAVKLDFERMDLRQVLAEAYETGENNIEISSGFPQQKFNFFVRVSKDSADMLQPLLLQAIKAAYRAEVRKVSREKQVLLLRYDKDAPHGGLSPSKSGGSTQINNGYVRAEGAGINDILGLLTAVYGTPVVDETGLTESYRINMEWAPGDKDSLTAALKDRLGITLVPASRVIDIVEAVPAE